jgi:hypothetical protein
VESEWRERWGQPLWPAAPPLLVSHLLLYMEVCGALSHTLAPLSFLSHVRLLHKSVHGLAKPCWIRFSSNTSRICWRFPRESTTSAAPLDRGNGGRRQAVRTTNYGGAARCSVHLPRSWDRQVNNYITHENCSRNHFVSSRVSFLYPRLDRY